LNRARGPPTLFSTTPKSQVLDLPERSIPKGVVEALAKKCAERKNCLVFNGTMVETEHLCLKSSRIKRIFPNSNAEFPRVMEIVNKYGAEKMVKEFRITDVVAAGIKDDECKRDE